MTIIPLKYTSDMKEVIGDKVFQTFDLAVILTMFGTIPKYLVSSPAGDSDN